MQRDWTLSVSQLNEYVRLQLASDPILRNLRVRGEISGIKRTASGHTYFTLKDDAGRVSCALFRQHAMKLSFTPKDGMDVVVTGSASLYVRDGTYQVYVEGMEQQGEGDLFHRFTLLKEKLLEEGLFDPAIKKPLPQYPRVIGIATSDTGAVLHDILRVGWARCPGMRFLLAPCRVQGSEAAGEIAAAIEALNGTGLCDVILCGRGGGSLEDLWPFNEESVARAIRASSVPVISCVGHETDFTIADFAADCRAATPSNAAEIAVPDLHSLKRQLQDTAEDLRRSMAAVLSSARASLEPYKRFFDKLDYSQSVLQPQRVQLGILSSRLDTALQKALLGARAAFDVETARLHALRPDAPIERGYALLMRAGAPAAFASLSLGDTVDIYLKGGQITAAVQNKQAGSAFADEKNSKADNDV